MKQLSGENSDRESDHEHIKHCWQNRDYCTIIAVAQHIPETIRQEGPKLLMWYDQALTRTGE